MLSSKPYLLRALNEWILDSALTPHIIADAQLEGVEVPPTAINDGKVVLNIDPQAVRDLVIDEAGVSFVARFGGVSQAVWLPMAAVEGIYARENGQGMMFGPETDAPAEAEKPSTEQSKHDASEKKGPALRVIK